MGGAQARRLCPQAVVVEPRMSAYSEASKAVYEVFDQTTPLVEGLSIDEAFLDVSGMGRISGSPPCIAARLRREVLERVGLPITVGVARTKFLAKVASGVAKPDGLLVVPPDGELAFLHPLPVERLWGVGAVTARKLHDRGITTVGQVARLAEEALVSLLGRASGRHLHALAHNRDPRAVQVGRRRRSIGAQRALGRTPRSWEASGRRPRRPRGPPRPPASGRAAGLPHGHASAALRRLHPSDSLAHPVRGDLPDPDDPGHDERVAHGGHAGDRASGPDPRRSVPRQPRGRPCRSSSRCRSIGSVPAPSMRRPTRCAIGSDPPRSPGPCSWAATRARRCRYSPTEPT